MINRTVIKPSSQKQSFLTHAPTTWVPNREDISESPCGWTWLVCWQVMSFPTASSFTAWRKLSGCDQPSLPTCQLWMADSSLISCWKKHLVNASSWGPSLSVEVREEQVNLRYHVYSLSTNHYIPADQHDRLRWAMQGYNLAGLENVISLSSQIELWIWRTVPSLWERFI